MSEANEDQSAHVADVPAPDKDGYWTRTPAGGLYYHANDPAREDEDQAAHVADEVRELLRWCDECQHDYRARQWRRSKMHYREGVTGWICPFGHELVRCDSDAHEWYQSDDYLQVCTRCHVERFHIAESEARGE